MARKHIRFTALLLSAALLLTGCGGAAKTSEPTAAEPTEASVVETEEEVTEPLHSSPEEALAKMSLDQKLHQMFIITPEALTGFNQVTQCGEASKLAMSEHPVGGLIYFSPNLQDSAQTKAMLTDTQHFMRATTGVGIFLAVDEEGGSVARVASNLRTTRLEKMSAYGERASSEEAYTVGQTLGKDIRQFGFNLDFAPVADVKISDTNELGDRIFSDDPEVVSKMVTGVVRGLQDTGVAATLKHFPGLGAEDGNAHTDEKIVIDRSLDELRETEFVPFQAGIKAGSDFVMVSHQIVTGVGDDLPACLSKAVCTDLLRGELGFEGVIVTDSMQMNTIAGSYSSSEAAVMAVQAGVDMLMIPEDFESALQGLKDAVASGEISESRIDESVLRILQEKEKLGLLD